MREIRAPQILLVAMEAWAKKSHYRDIYKTINKKTLGIAKQAFGEMVALTPMNWVTWWATEHNRFIRAGFSQRELCTLHECMHQFLIVYARKGLDSGKETAQKQEDSASPNRI